jgi:hypothetical protein
MLVAFARSGRFDLELPELIWRGVPDGQVTDAAQVDMVVDDFLLKHRLSDGTTVVEEFVLEHPELPDDERDLLLSWLNAVDGVFEVAGKERDAVMLFNLTDGLTYRTRSSMGRQVFRPLRKGMFLVGRLVPLRDDWLTSGYLSFLQASERDQALVIAAEHALDHPEAVLRNPAKLAEARSMLGEQHKVFTDLFGADLIVVPGREVLGKLETFRRRIAEEQGSDEPSEGQAEDYPQELLAAESVAIHFVEVVGLCFYPGYHLLQELFAEPALITSQRHREVLWGMLRDSRLSPEPLRQLAARDPAKASQVFAGLFWRKDGFDWEADGEALLRRCKPSYFDGSVLPRSVPLSRPLIEAYQRALR